MGDNSFRCIRDLKRARGKVVPIVDCHYRVAFRTIVVPLGFLLCLGVVACTNKMSDECAAKLQERIAVGSDQAQAEHILDECGFAHALDSKSSTIRALKHGTTTNLVRQDWRAEIKLDATGKVTSVKVEKVFTGP
jgi:hypothetical protein